MNAGLCEKLSKYLIQLFLILMLTDVLLCMCVCTGPAKIKHVIFSSDRFCLFFFHFSIVMCFYMTKSLTLTCCAPLILMGARYYYSRKVIQNYLDCALHTDMADIDAYYMKPTGKRQGTHHCFHTHAHAHTHKMCVVLSVPSAPPSPARS